MEIYLAVMVDRFETLIRELALSVTSLAPKGARRSSELDDVERDATDALDSLRAALDSLRAAQEALYTPAEPY